jgi:hypothetical protein
LAIPLATLALGCLMAAAVLAAAVGSLTRISQVGPDGNPAFDGLAPAVAYNPQANQYLVVWEGDELVDDETSSCRRGCAVRSSARSGDGSSLPCA